jgi:hypothetical protein
VGACDLSPNARQSTFSFWALIKFTQKAVCTNEKKSRARDEAAISVEKAFFIHSPVLSIAEDLVNEKINKKSLEFEYYRNRPNQCVTFNGMV